MCSNSLFRYDIYFNRIQSNLLKPPYQTNCIEYDIVDKHTPQSWSDCIERCILGIYQEPPPKGCGCHPTHILTRKEFAQKLPICDFYNDDHRRCYDIEVENQTCPDDCKHECEDAFYEYDEIAHAYPKQAKIDAAEGKFYLAFI